MGKRTEPYGAALIALRSRIRNGAYRQGGRLSAPDLALSLKVSPTPIREALAHLAGQGIIEDRPGEGYFTWRLGEADIDDLFRLNLAHTLTTLQSAAFPEDPAISAGESLARLRQGNPGAGALTFTERLFHRLAIDAGGRLLLTSQQSLEDRLHVVRLFELGMLADLQAEAANLASLYDARDRAQLAAALRAFHDRRNRLSAQFAAKLEEGVGET